MFSDTSSEQQTEEFRAKFTGNLSTCLTSHLSPSPSSSETPRAWGSWGAKGLPALGPMTSTHLPLTKHSLSPWPPFFSGPSLLRVCLGQERRETRLEKTPWGQSPGSSVPATDTYGSFSPLFFLAGPTSLLLPAVAWFCASVSS